MKTKLNHPISFYLLNGLKASVFITIHLGCLAAIWVGVSHVAVLVCVALYFIRMFAITGGYHRYFSHRTYSTSRAFQFILALIGASAAQKGPLWWAAHHRHHHRHSDTEEDLHAPKVQGILWAHAGWILSTKYIQTRYELIKDFLKYPELRILDNNHVLVPIGLALLCYLTGAALNQIAPGLHTSGLQMLVWGFCISTTLTYHGTFLINSATHLIGTKRFVTGDDSRNNLVLALITLGEGWHNNHHRYPGSERQGFYWWEIDITHYILKFLSWFGIVWDLRTPPDRIYAEAEANKAKHLF